MKHSCIAGTTIFPQRSYTTRMALESSRLAELKYAFSAAWDVRRKKLRAFDWPIWTKIFLARDGTFFSFLFCRTFPKLCSFNMHLQYLCVIYCNRAYQKGKNLSASASLIHGTPEHARTTLEPTAYRSIAENRRSTKNLSERRGRKTCSQTGWLLIFFSLRKGWRLLFFLFFFPYLCCSPVPS